MRGIADDGLIEIANLHRDAPFGIGERTKIANVAIATDPNWRSFGDFTSARFEPFIKLDRAAANVSVRRARHLKVAGVRQNIGSIAWSGHLPQREIGRLIGVFSGDVSDGALHAF